MKEEVMRIMKMVEEGKIDSERAAELIDALKAPKGEEKKLLDAPGSEKVSFEENRMLRVKVISSTKDNVNIQLPVKFIKGVLSAVGKIPVNVQGMESIDMNMIVQAIDSGLIGKIVDVQSGNGDIVEVVIE